MVYSVIVVSDVVWLPAVLRTPGTLKNSLDVPPRSLYRRGVPWVVFCIPPWSVAADI